MLIIYALKYVFIFILEIHVKGLGDIYLGNDVRKNCQEREIPFLSSSHNPYHGKHCT